ncbi:Pleckstrin homology domain-containing protein [Trametes elegans]|nr:Pleckstrin homology domain-containing protein [Trametes elegans]
MRRRWRESDWGRARKQQRRKVGAVPKWVGNSFDVGVFLGVDVLDGCSGSSAGAETPSEAVSSHLPEISVSGVGHSTAAETFVTAPSHLSTPAHEEPGSFTHEEPGPLTHEESGPLSHGEPVPPILSLNVSRDQESVGLASASSSTALLPHAQPASEVQPSAKTIPPASTGTVNGHTKSPSSYEANNKGRDKGKGKDMHVHYEEPPAPPSEVLARRGSSVEETSAGAAEQATAENRVQWGDVIMRDRMLVRVSYTEDSVPSTFDESLNRTTRHLENDGWVEFIVAWRKDRLELYADHHTPGKEWLSGHKKLAYIVPLGTSTTRLSLYSFVDLSFCLSCPPARVRVDSKRHRRYFGSSRGTNVFVFKAKSRTRAVDWVWHLWRHLGGQLPPYIEIRSPTLDTRVTIDVPGFDSADIEAAYNVFSHDNIISLCEKNLRTVPEFRNLMEREHAEGATFELAWRQGTNLDWVWRLSDVQDKHRKWAVLCGLALAQAGRAPHLEFRRKRHLPTRLHMRDGTRLDEPHAVEGFVDRIRPNSQLKQSLYLVTHDGYLFALSPARAHPPPAPGAPEPSSPASFSASVPDQVYTGRKAEVRRGQLQTLEATGVSDLRSIVAVRRAFQLVPPQVERVDAREAADWEDSDEFWAQVERSGSDDEDAGGEAGLGNVRDRARLRMRRSFELVLTSGRVVRFEAYSCATALEWIVRLRPLISYWKKRHQYDARLEMDILHSNTGRPPITPQRAREHHDHGHRHDTELPVPLDRDASLPDLDFFYNWCVLDGCRPILKCGRLYGRKGWWGQYKHIQLVLIAGHLVQYKITGRTSLHHRKDKALPLLDAYVCSGYFAAQYLPEDQYDANAPPVARRYQDGLETDDGAEDTLFVLWYRAPRGAAPGVRRDAGAHADVPPLAAKRKAVVFRTRSRLERDAWVWAINVEIERIVRASREREEAVRMAGELIKT